MSHVIQPDPLPDVPAAWAGFAYVLRGSLRTVALGQLHGEPILMRGPYMD